MSPFIHLVKRQCGNSVIYATTRQAPEALRRARISSPFMVRSCVKSLKYPKKDARHFFFCFLLFGVALIIYYALLELFLQ